MEEGLGITSQAAVGRTKFLAMSLTGVYERGGRQKSGRALRFTSRFANEIFCPYLYAQKHLLRVTCRL